MPGRDIIVVGASAGGVDVLAALARGLPPGLPASLFVVCHFPPGGRSVLPEILSRAGPLLAPLLADLVQRGGTAAGGATAVDPIEQMPEVVDQDFEEQARNRRRGQVSTFTCPECGGSLWQVDEAKLIRFRCHVGHAYNGEA